MNINSDNATCMNMIMRYLEIICPIFFTLLILDFFNKSFQNKLIIKEDISVASQEMTMIYSNTIAGIVNEELILATANKIKFNRLDNISKYKQKFAIDFNFLVSSFIDLII